MVRNFLLPKIYPITDRPIAGLPHEEQIELLINGGSEFIQLRDKDASSREFFEMAQACLKITREKNAKLIVNDRVDIAMILEADGVHLGQDDLHPEQARRLLGKEAIIGISTHTIEQVRAALKLPVDYVAFGPIFGTKTKANHHAVVGIEGLKRVREVIGNLPLVAIGGIDLENLQEVFAAGADSAAMISALASNPGKITENIERAIRAVE
jgi:thiamine-phosphate pyrophosphorylase